MTVSYANPHEERYCRLLVAMWRVGKPWVTLDDLPLGWAPLRALKAKGWIRQKDRPFHKAEFELTESGKGMAALVASLYVQ